MTSQSPLALLERARRADASAFETLIRPHVASIRRFTYTFTRNWADADDLAQEALIKAFRSLHTFQGQAALGTWLYTVARSVCRDHVRSHAARRQTSEEASEIDELADDVDGPDLLLDGKIGAELLWQAIAALDPVFRVPVVLFDIEGLSYEQIARIEHVPVGTVRSRLSRARVRLNTLLRTPDCVPHDASGTNSDAATSNAPGEAAE